MGTFLYFLKVFPNFPTESWYPQSRRLLLPVGWLFVFMDAILLY